MFRLPTCLAVLLAAALLSACQSADLIDLNRAYIDLIAQQNAVRALARDGEMGEIGAAETETSLRIAFADNGDEAVKRAARAEAATKSAQVAAERTRARRNEVSFLSVAVRSYLSSGAVADHKMAAPALRAISVCKELTGLQDLPTTCGYFHIALPVGVHNERVRAVRPVLARARGLTPRQKLTVADGKALEAAFTGVIGQLDALAALDPSNPASPVKWADAAPGLTSHFRRQQNKLLCNAMRIQGRILNAASDAGWNADESARRTNTAFVKRRAALMARPGGFDMVRDCGR